MSKPMRERERESERERERERESKRERVRDGERIETQQHLHGQPFDQLIVGTRWRRREKHQLALHHYSFGSLIILLF